MYPVTTLVSIDCMSFMHLEMVDDKHHWHKVYGIKQLLTADRTQFIFTNCRSVLSLETLNEYRRYNEVK